MSPEDFISAIAPAAQACMRRTKIPTSFTIAQGALESSWGASKLATTAFNLFGVKADRAWKGPTVIMPTIEVIAGKRITVSAQWRRYSGWQACIDDHAAFLLTNPRYKAAFAYADGPSFARAIAAAGYATDPQYAEKLIAVIRGRNLSALDAA
ncbi:hypothetical protein PanNE5_29910 [Pandoraea sp. NE5]|uniref:glycoside hydrolase family 73 protein n=1 Tax=Pandoraea sp. NE5 TaxID=2904129 RepID=UPI0021C306F2|nr:glucosaminidase domain-containing protein [Pandoraea sp. NE5]BDD93551.1 hypothetical protein PanNE5_29910 [Pandoraea sp. NE5]